MLKLVEASWSSYGGPGEHDTVAVIVSGKQGGSAEQSRVGKKKRHRSTEMAYVANIIRLLAKTLPFKVCVAPCQQTRGTVSIDADATGTSNRSMANRSRSCTRMTCFTSPNCGCLAWWPQTIYHACWNPCRLPFQSYQCSSQRAHWPISTHRELRREERTNWTSFAKSTCLLGVLMFQPGRER